MEIVTILLANHPIKTGGGVLLSVNLEHENSRGFIFVYI